jgi:RNA polymerase sigma-70 factor (ECF subfamily)
MTASPALRLVSAPAPPDRHIDIASLQRGDAQALATAYGVHAARLRTIVMRLTASVEDAEDVVQELFLQLPVALAGYDERGQFDGWLTTLAIRRALMHERRERVRRHDALPDGLEVAAPTVDGDPIAGARVLRALQQLTPALRHVFVLRTVHDYTHPEIAAALGIAINTSEVRLHRAVQQLRVLLEDLR